jgi:hypothetical protein
MEGTQTVGDPRTAERGGGTVTAVDGGVPPQSGQPVSDVPALVEFVGFEEPGEAAEATALPIIGPRPVRRTFLAPVAGAVPPRPAATTTRDLRPRVTVSRQPAPAPSAPAAEPTVPPPIAASPPVRRWPRYVAVASAVAAALALSVALEVDISPQWLHRVGAAMLQSVARWSAPQKTGDAPADPKQRVAFYSGRAKTGDANAEFALAVLYAKGDGVAQDYAAAAKWFHAAAEHGVPRAQYDLGVLYERGRGVTLDYAEAAAWYQKAAEQNYALAQYNLAVAYTKGEGVDRDAAKAAAWYHRAAAQGVVAAMVNLAILYERGEGLDASTVDAYAWYRAAARRGSQPAARRADELLRAFAPADQTRAEAKTTEVFAAIHDAIGESAHVTATTPAGDAAKTQAPVFKSGIESETGTPAGGDGGAENP